MKDAKTNPEPLPGGLSDQHQWIRELEAAKSEAGPVEQPPPQRSVKRYCRLLSCWKRGDGREALEIAQSQALDLVITDIKMPELDGLGLLTYLRHQHPDLPVLALSGIVGADEIEGYTFDAFIENR